MGMEAFKKLIKNRYFLFGLMSVFLFAALGFRLAHLTVEKGEEYYTMAQQRKRIGLTLRGTRGNILDRNGIPMATNRQIYIAQIDRQWMPKRDEQINTLLYKAIKIIEDNGDRLEDNLPIKYGTKIYEDNVIPYTVTGFYYDFNTQNFDRHQERYDRWRKDTGIKQDLSADEMLRFLRNRYKIDAHLSDQEARKIISIRIDLYLNRFKQHEPVRIAENISPAAVSQLATFSDDLPGIQTVVEAGRYYPNGLSAQHIIGYVGRITQENIAVYAEMVGRTPTQDGYNIYSDKFGQDGIEAYAEGWLTGSTKDKHGDLVAEVDASRRVIKVLRENVPQNGNDVVLTIDSRLQRIAENILAEELAKMREGVYPYQGNNQAPLAHSGSIVIMDVNTGEILTMASYANSKYPYDLNDFSRGITTQEFQNLSRDPSNPLYAFPLYAFAFQGGLEPGSVFKMAVGIGALMEGKVTVAETILDRLRHKNGPACWSTVSHGSINIIDAIKVSCNYFFTVIGERLGIDDLHKWAKLYGLHGPTGLEILSLPWKSDMNTVAHPDVLKNQNTPAHQAKRVKATLSEKYEVMLTNEDALALVSIERSDGTLAGGLWEVDQLTQLLHGMGHFTDNKLRNNAINDIRDALSYSTKWENFDTLQASIGQSSTAVSPLGIARYIAALSNGGKVLETHVVKEIRTPGGDVLDRTEPVYNQLDVKEEYANAIMEGMHRVVYSAGGAGGNGTAMNVFKGLSKEITLGGKTGTAQVIPGFPERNTAWFTAFTPYDNPEVSIVVTIPNGKTSGNAAPVGRRMLEEYYRLMHQDQFNALPLYNELSQ